MLCFISFQQNMEFCCNSDVVLNKTKKYKTFARVSMFKLLCKFVVVLEYDEMN
jgi:hypothetical protein